MVVARCAGCPYNGAAIGPRGDPAAKVVVVGEAPGADELRTGIPFVGQAGQLLSRALAKAGLEEGSLYVTNAMSCRPPVGTPPLREAIDACRERLLSEVRTAPRELLILLGNSALRSITGNHNLKITSSRGKVIDTEFGPALPTFHPAYILRNPGEFPRLLADFQYAGTLSTGMAKKSPGETRWDLVTPDNIHRVVSFLIKQPLLACDIETSGYSPWTTQILCIGVGWVKNRVAVFPKEILHDVEIRRLFAAEGPRWIYQNGKYDSSFITHLLAEKVQGEAGRERTASGVRQEVLSQTQSRLQEAGSTSEGNGNAQGILQKTSGNGGPHTRAVGGSIRTSGTSLRNMQAEEPRAVHSQGTMGSGSRSQNGANQGNPLSTVQHGTGDVLRQQGSHTAGVIVPRVDEDTMLMHYCLNETRGTHDLETLGSDYLGAPNWKAQMMAEVIKKGHLKKRSDSYALIPPDILYDYNAKDVDVTFQLFGALTDELAQPRNRGLIPLYRNVLIPASRFLQKVEAAGMYVDLKTVNALEHSLYDDLRNSLAEINELIAPIWDPKTYQTASGTMKPPIEFNPGSPKQVLYILRLLGIRVPNTLEATIKPLARRHPFVGELLKYKKTNKLLSTYVEGVREHIQPDGRVHCTYLIHGTTTGRLSSRNPNMQNVPREARIRNMFQAAPGNTLLEFDYSQVELRVLAYFSNDTFLRQVYQDGRDLHDEVALALFGPGFTKEQRVRAKFVNFGIAYGRGAKSISEEFKIPIEESAEMIRGWFRRAPEAAAYIKHCREAPALGKSLSTPFGRRRRFGLVIRENLNTLQNEAVNFPIQSTASDLTLSSAINCAQQLSQQWGAMITNLIHDSILVEVSESADIEALSKYIVGEMEATPQRILNTDIPFVVSVAQGSRWGDLKG